MKLLARLFLFAVVSITATAAAQTGTPVSRQVPAAPWTHLTIASLVAPATAPIGLPIGLQLFVAPAPAAYLLELSIGGTMPGIVLPPPGAGVFPLNPPFLFTTLGAGLPGIFQNFAGLTDPGGNAGATLAIPFAPALIGVTLSTAFVVIDPTAPLGIGAISNPAQTLLLAGTTLSITSIVPPVAASGQLVTVYGTGFTASLVASISGLPLAPVSITPASFTFTMPAGTYCDAPIVVAVPGGPSAFQQFSPGPAIIAVSGAAGAPAGGTPLTVTGLDFHAGTTLTIGGSAAMIVTMTTTTIDALAPPGASGSASLVVASLQGCPAVTTYVYQ